MYCMSLNKRLSSPIDQDCTLVAKSLIGFIISGLDSRPSHNHAVIWAETTRPMLLGNEGLGQAALEKPGGLPAVAEIVAEK